MRQNTGRRWSEAKPLLIVSTTNQTPTEILSGLRHFFSCCILSRGSFSAALRKRLLRRRASCYALPLRRQRSSGSPHQARMAIGPSSKGLLRRLPVILPPLLGSSRWVFVAYCSVRHGVCPYTLGALVLSSQSISPTRYSSFLHKALRWFIHFIILAEGTNRR